MHAFQFFIYPLAARLCEKYETAATLSEILI